MLVLLASAGEVPAKLILSQRDALRLAFPAGVAVEKRTAYLTEQQRAAAEAAAQARVESRLWTYYVGVRDGRPLGYAYFDTVVVRTMPAAVMVLVGPEGAIDRLEVLSFEEPEDYLPRPRWLDLFRGRRLEEGLRVGGVLKNVAGATLTSHSLAEAARRAAALHRVLHPAPVHPGPGTAAAGAAR